MASILLLAPWLNYYCWSQGLLPFTALLTWDETLHQLHSLNAEKLCHVLTSCRFQVLGRVFTGHTWEERGKRHRWQSFQLNRTVFARHYLNREEQKKLLSSSWIYLILVYSVSWKEQGSVKKFMLAYTVNSPIKAIYENNFPQWWV